MDQRSPTSGIPVTPEELGATLFKHFLSSHSKSLNATVKKFLADSSIKEKIGTSINIKLKLQFDWSIARFFLIDILLTEFRAATIVSPSVFCTKDQLQITRDTMGDEFFASLKQRPYNRMCPLKEIVRCDEELEEFYAMVSSTTHRNLEVSDVLETSFLAIADAIFERRMTDYKHSYKPFITYEHTVGSMGPLTNMARELYRHTTGDKETMSYQSIIINIELIRFATMFMETLPKLRIVSA